MRINDEVGVEYCINKIQVETVWKRDEETSVVELAQV